MKSNQPLESVVVNVVIHYVVVKTLVILSVVILSVGEIIVLIGILTVVLLL